MPAESKPNLFISYARADDESFVERLHNDLETRGIRVWWDRQSMSNRGLTFLDEIQRAIESVDRVIAVVGPNALKSKYVLHEWDYALLFGKAVVPILCLGDYASIPGNLTRDIRNYHCPDFRVERPYNQALDELERIVREPVASFGRVRATPALPPGFLPRRDAMNAMWEVLYADIERPKPVASAAEQTLVLHGMGGTGKSVLAAAFARSIDTRRTANDGIVWLKAGRDTKPGDRLANLCLLGLTFNDDPKYYADEKSARGQLSQLLADKGCVIVLDDVWSKDDAEPYLNALGPRCRLLVTTRDAGLAVLGRSQALDVLDDDQALELLARSSGHAVDVLPTAAKEVAKECGDLPLALAMIGAMVNGNPDRWEHALHRLRTLKLDKIQFSIPNYDYTNLLLAIQVSIDDLQQDQQARYFELAVFPPGISIPEDTLRVFWEPAGVDPYDATDLIDLFVRRSLARTFAKGSILLHDLQSDYVRARITNQVALNGRLLDAYAKRCSNGWSSGPDDGYYFEHLPWHLKEAGRTTELRQLLFNFDWLQAKLGATDANALIADYDYLPEDKDLHLVQSAIRLSAHVFTRDARQLAGQLTGRMLGNIAPNIQALLKQAAKRKAWPWLRPMNRGLTAPGGSLIRTLESPTRAVALTADGRRAVSASWGHTLQLWDLENGQSVLTLQGHNGGVNSVAMTSDGRRAVSASGDKTLRFWDLENGQTIRTLEDHTDSVNAVAVTPDGRRAVSASSDETLRVWDLESGQTIRTLKGHTAGLSAVAVTSDGRRAVSASWDQTLRVWDLKSGQVLHLLKGHKSGISAAAMTPDGRRAVSGGHGHTVLLWDLETGQMLRALKGHTGGVNALAFTADGRRAVSASDDHTLRFWDLENGQSLLLLEGHSNPVHAVALTPDGHYAVSGSASMFEHTLRVWDLEAGQAIGTVKSRTSVVQDVAVAANGHHAVAAFRDHNLRVWDLETGQVLRTLKGHTGRVSAVALTADGCRAVSASDDETLRVWDLGTGQTIRLLEGHRSEVHAVAVTPDGRRAISGSDDNTLHIWDLQSGYVLHTVEIGWVTSLAVAPDGRHVVLGRNDRVPLVWDLETRQTLRALEGHTGPVYAVAIVPSGRCAVSGSADKTVRVWNLETGQALRILNGHTDSIYAVAVSAHGLIISASEDHTLRLWELENGKEIATFTGDGNMLCCAFTPNGQTVIAGDSLGQLHLLRLVEADETKSPIGDRLHRNEQASSSTDS